MVSLLRQIEVTVANGMTTAQASKEAGIVEQAYRRCREDYGGLPVEAVEGVGAGELEAEAFGGELDLDNLVLKDYASGNF